MDIFVQSLYTRILHIGQVVWFVFVVVFTFVATAIAVEPIHLKVVVSIPPQAYFVSRIGGSSVEIVTLINPGQSPAVFDPTPKRMTEIQQAVYYFTAGVPFENGLLPKIIALWPELSVVDLSLDNYKPLNQMDSSESHGGHAHDHDSGAPHVWLDPLKVKQMATIIYDNLSEANPIQASVYRENYDIFVQDLDSVDNEIRWRLATVKRRTFYVYHPAYDQFADAYGLTQIPIEIDGKEPSARQLVTFIEQAKQDSVQAVFVQPQFSGKSAGIIAEAVRAKLIEMDPLAYDYLRNLRSMTNNLVHALGGDRFQDIDKYNKGQR